MLRKPAVSALIDGLASYFYGNEEDLAQPSREDPEAAVGVFSYAFAGETPRFRDLVLDFTHRGGSRA